MFTFLPAGPCVSAHFNKSYLKITLLPLDFTTFYTPAVFQVYGLFAELIIATFIPMIHLLIFWIMKFADWCVKTIFITDLIILLTWRYRFFSDPLKFDLSLIIFNSFALFCHHQVWLFFTFHSGKFDQIPSKNTVFSIDFWTYRWFFIDFPETC